MIKIKKENKFLVYLIFIVSLSVLTSNMAQIISPDPGKSLIIFFLSIIIFYLIHRIYYKIYWYLIKDKSKEKISEGLLHSSLTGGILISILSIFNFTFTRMSNYDFNYENTLFTITFFLLIVIYLISIFILAKYDIKSLRIGKADKFGIILGSIFFYGLNFFMCYTVMVILMIGVIGLF